jgi:hypothetical protein
VLDGWRFTTTALEASMRPNPSQHRQQQQALRREVTAMANDLRIATLTTLNVENDDEADVNVYLNTAMFTTQAVRKC